MLREDGSGAERAVTILGPWDSKPEEGVYSYESEFAQALLGAKRGERVRAGGADLDVVSIERWR